MNDAIQTKGKILSVIQIKGPSLPVQISREAETSPLFAGAFLSELAKEEAIKISSMKVGGSPLYYIKGQEHLLDNFFKYLPEKEKEAFLMLKEKRVLEDSKQTPAIRVALRNIKDFAFPFKKDGEVFWRFHTTTEQEVRDILEPKENRLVKQPAEQPVKQSVEQPAKQPEQVFKQEHKQTVKKSEQLDIGLRTMKRQFKKEEKFENPLVMEEKGEVKKYSEFVSKVVDKINREYNLIEEKYYKPKEYSCVIQIKSDLGPINFLAFARDKKKLSETDVKQMVSEAQKIPLPALILYKRELSKKALEYSAKYFSIVKLEKI